MITEAYPRTRIEGRARMTALPPKGSNHPRVSPLVRGHNAQSSDRDDVPSLL